MRKPIRRAAVIGAGVMGSGIAAHLANAGVQVGLNNILPVRRWLCDQLSGATRGAARPEKTDGFARGSWGLGL
jgi:3-hydroxyacyl-CoA dehydrogenase